VRTLPHLTKLEPTTEGQEGVTSHRTDRTINSIIGKAESIGTKLPNARHRLIERLNNIDGYTTGSDAPKVKATSELTGVERAADLRTVLDDLRSLDGRLNDVVKILSELDRDCDRHIGTRHEVPRCTATGREGAIEWADPNCYDAQLRGTLCAKCYMRERRWRQRNGLGTREVA
jgi:hypothetical protein